MGREIRNVPPGWKHPKKGNNYIPLYDQTFAEAIKEWRENGSPLDEDPRLWSDCYRPGFTEEATHFQMYETVTKGTPVSPIFDSLEALGQWLINCGHSPSGVKQFLEFGWAPSMVVSGGQVRMNIEALTEFAQDKEEKSCD